jgi:hypothetical protein
LSAWRQKEEYNSQGANIGPRLRQFALILGTSVLLALLVSTLTGLLLPTKTAEGYGKAIQIAIISGLIFISLYLIWRLIAVRSISRFAWFEIIYSAQDGEVLPFMFESAFAPQDMARQAFAALLLRKPEYRNSLRQNLAQRSADFFEKSRKGHRLTPEDKHLFGLFVEYLFVKWMAGWISIVVNAEQRWGLKEKEISASSLPPALRENVFIDLMTTMEPADIVEQALSQIKVTVPSDFNLSFEWPKKEARRSIPEPNSGEFKLKGKYCTIHAWFINSTWGPVSTVQSGHYPYLKDIPISFTHLDYVVHKPLYSIGFVAGFNATFNVVSLLISRKARGHVDLAEKLGESFVDHFDESRFLQVANARRQQLMFNDFSERLASLEEKLDQHFPSSKPDLEQELENSLGSDPPGS